MFNHQLTATTENSSLALLRATPVARVTVKTDWLGHVPGRIRASQPHFILRFPRECFMRVSLALNPFPNSQPPTELWRFSSRAAQPGRPSALHRHRASKETPDHPKELPSVCKDPSTGIVGHALRLLADGDSNIDRSCPRDRDGRHRSRLFVNARY
jgi:hypothetical protein